MDVVDKIILFTHLLGFSAVAGGLLSQLKSEKKYISTLVLLGARWQFVSGVVLYALEHADIRHPVAVIKIVLALFVLALCEMNRKKQLSLRLYWILMCSVATVLGLALFITHSS